MCLQWLHDFISIYFFGKCFLTGFSLNGYRDNIDQMWLQLLNLKWIFSYRFLSFKEVEGAKRLMFIDKGVSKVKYAHHESLEQVQVYGIA